MKLNGYSNKVMYSKLT